MTAFAVIETASRTFEGDQLGELLSIILQIPKKRSTNHDDQRIF